MTEPSNIARLELSDAYKPEDEDLTIRRAIFFCHSLNGHLRQNMLRLIDRLNAGEFGDVQNEIEEWTFDQMIKEMTSSYVHLAGLDQGGASSPEWLTEFLFEAQQEADSICPEPAAIEIIEKRGAMTATEMLTDLDQFASQVLGISENEAAQNWLREFLAFSENFTSELLALCLSQPLEALSKHLQLYAE